MSSSPQQDLGQDETFRPYLVSHCIQAKIPLNIIVNDEVNLSRVDPPGWIILFMSCSSWPRAMMFEKT